MKCDICGKNLEPEGSVICLDKNQEVIEGREAVYTRCCDKMYIAVDNNNGIEFFGFPESVYQRIRNQWQ